MPLVLHALPDGSKVYVTDWIVILVARIDTALRDRRHDHDGGAVLPGGIAVHPDGTRVYVANEFAGQNISVIDTSNNNVTETISLPYGYPYQDLAFNPSGTRAYVTNLGNRCVGYRYHLPGQ